MKKVLSIILVGLMVLSLAACGEKVEEPVSVPREAATPAPSNAIVGSYTLKAEYVPFEAALINDVSNSPDMDVLGNTVYVSNGDTEIKMYTIDGAKLTYVKTVNVEDTGDVISVDGNGKIYADGGVFEAKIYDPETNASGEAVASGELTASKNADFALTYFTGRETVTAIKDGVADDWLINGTAGLGKFESISDINIVGDTVIIGGADSENNIVAAFDIDGNQQMISSGSLAGSLPTAVVKTENGYVSASVDDMTFVNNEGGIIGEVDANELFGLTNDTLWIYEMTPLADGSLLVLARLSKSYVIGDETVLFRVSGF